MTADLCCDRKKGPQGEVACWDATFTFERCCGVSARLVDPGSVPGLPLLGGGQMPMAGVGMCCRPSSYGEAARQAVVDWLLMGGRHIDDATGYSNHQEVGAGVRQAIAKGVPRADVFLTTKIPPEQYGFEAASRWVTHTLEELGLDYIDLVLLHLPKVPEGEDQQLCKVPSVCRQETWLALHRAKAQGQIKHLGVSNFGPRQMEELLALHASPVEVNQLEYHPWVPRVHLDTVEWCHQRGIAVTAYGSMGSAAGAEQLMLQDGLKQIGAAHGKTPGQVLLRWAVQHNVSVIPGTSTPKHMEENMRIFDFTLASWEMSMLDGIPEDGRFLHFGHWPDQAP